MGLVLALLGVTSCTSGAADLGPSTTAPIVPLGAATTTPRLVIPAPTTTTSAASRSATTLRSGATRGDEADNELSVADRLAILRNAYEAMRVEECCGQHQPVGVVANLGFRYDEGSVYIESGPFDFVAAARISDTPAEKNGLHLAADGQVVIFECGFSWYVAEYLKNGLKAEVPLEAMSLLRDALACGPS